MHAEISRRSRERIGPRRSGQSLALDERQLSVKPAVSPNPGWGGRHWKFPFAIKAPKSPVRVDKSLKLLFPFVPVVPTIGLMPMAA
jgi:hypothetical protein